MDGQVSLVRGCLSGTELWDSRCWIGLCRIVNLYLPDEAGLSILISKSQAHDA